MNQFLSLLNEEQREAVTDREHNLLILASAGSGKTRVITNKIAYYLSEGILKPYQILAVTFTNKAAKEMQDRVEKMLPGSDISQMLIKTFHSFGLYILLRERERFSRLSPMFSIYDDDDSLSLLANSYPGLDRKEIREIYREIARAKEQGLKPDDDEVSRFGYEIPGFRNYFARYEHELEKSGNVDFSDLISLPVSLLGSNKEVREKYQRRFKLILVDEYQDSNKMQFRLLSLLTSPSVQLCVVGDDDQSIYRFRGAEIKNILSFTSQFPNVREIKLEKNYRSTSEILSIADKLIANNVARHKKSIISANDRHGAKPELLLSESGSFEAERVAEIIERDGEFDSTAVIYRTNAQSMEFERVFQRRGIPHKVVGALRFYEREEIKDALALLSLAINPYDSVSFSRIVNKPARGIGKKAFSEITALSDNFLDSLQLYLESGKKKMDGVSSLISAFEELGKDLDEERPLGDALYRVLDHLGFMSYWAKESDSQIRKSREENISTLIGDLNNYGQGRQALSMYLQNITLDSTTLNGDGKDDRKGVTLITMHNTKGLEFKRVFLVGLEDEIIPGFLSKDEDDIEEERRILYVAITRAMDILYLSYAASRFRWGSHSAEHPSRFLLEIPANLYSGHLRGNTFSSSPSSHIWESVTPRWGKKIENRPTWASGIDLVKAKCKYKSGDIVYSATYGEGKVVESNINKYGEEMVKIAFRNETIVLNSKFASLSSEPIAKPLAGTEDFEAGDKVKSPALGIGKIREVVKDDVNTILVIEFDRGTVRLNKAYAKNLVKIL